MLQILGRLFFSCVIAADQVASVNADVHARRFLNSFPFIHYLVDFTQFHPVSADLDHPVFSAMENQVSFLVPGHLIAAVVHAFAWLEGVFRETFRGFLRHVVISGRQPGTGDAKFADHAGLVDSFPVFIDQADFRPPAWFPQAQRSAASGRMQQHGRACLAGAVAFPDARIPFSFCCVFFAHQQHVFQRQRTVKLSQHGIHLRRAEHASDLPF